MPEVNANGINSFLEFRQELAHAITSLQGLTANLPEYPVFQNIIRQLEAISNWTAQGRRPTPEEKKSIDFGLVVARELDDDPDPVIRQLSDTLHSLSLYFDKSL